MKSPYRYAIVYDIETGGFTEGINPLMELAACVVDINTLSIIDRWEALVAFRMNLAFTANMTTKKLAADIFKYNAKSTDGVKSVNFKGKAYDKTSFHEELETEVERFLYFVDTKIGQRLIFAKDLGLIAKSEFVDHFTLLKNLCYTQGALSVNKIALKTIIKDGLHYEDVYDEFKQFIKKYTIGSNKPILAGHNILEFDNPYIELLFTEHKDDLHKHVSKLKIDTLQWVKLRWPEADAYNLGAACHKLGITIDDAHRAMSDTEANAKLLIKLLESMRGYDSEEKQYTRKKISLNY